MKTKHLKLNLYSILLIIFFGFSAVSNASAQSSPEAVIKAFYNWHIRSVSQNAGKKKGKATLRKYVTTSLIQKIPKFESEMEADYFIQSQEWNDDWEDKFTVSKPTVNGTNATSIVTFPDGYPRVKVTLKKEAGAWKIDKVQNAQR